MMMPANFTAVNSEVVYGGADLFSILADTTAPVWNAANVKGNWGGDNGQKIFGDDGSLKTNFYGATANGDDMTFGNKVMRTLGLASVVYTLGTAPAKIGFNDAVSGITDSNGKLGV